MENIIVTTKPELQQLIIEAVISVVKNANNLAQSNQIQTNYLSTEEASKIIKKTPGALRQIVHRGEIPSIKRGNSLLFLHDDLILWIEQGRRTSSNTFEEPAKYLKPVENKSQHHSNDEIPEMAVTLTLKRKLRRK